MWIAVPDSKHAALVGTQLTQVNTTAQRDVTDAPKAQDLQHDTSQFVQNN
jgi:hypothetical protein